MKIYTKIGDKGTTSLFGGGKIPKSDLRLEAYGTVDELNSFLGLAIAKVSSSKSKELLIQVQNDLFVVGSDLAAPKKDSKYPIPRVEEEMIKFLEEQIDEIESKIPPLKSFILPGGTEAAALINIARAVCRRAERKTVALSEVEKINEKIIVYLNRLSDFLFELARFENFITNTPEREWKK